MADRSGYIGRAPGDSSVIIAKQTHSATGVTTDFTLNAGYTPGYIDVYLNGSRLIGGGTDFTATNGTTIGLTTAAGNGDVVELVAYKAFNVGNVTNASSNFDVGNNLTVSNLSTLADVNVSGTVTATTFVGSGSGLTGLASTDYIITGTAATFNNTTDFQNVSVSGVTTAAGAFKVTDTTGSTSSSTGALIVSGGLGVAENLSVGGTITYEDVTSVDSLGIVTARTGLRVTAGGVVVTAGVATFSAPVKVDSTPTFSEGLHVTAGVTTIAGNQTVAGTATFAKKTTVNATLEATEGLNVTAGVTTIAGNQTVAGTSSFAKKTTVNATLDATEGLHVSAGVATFAGALKVGTGASIFSPSSNILTLGTNSAEGLRLDSSGRLIVGHTASDDRDGYQSALQVSGTGGDDSSASVGRWSNDASSPGLVLSKSRNATPGSHTVVQADDILGIVQFQGDDGTNYHVGAQIQADVVSGVGNDDMPADLVFKTNSGSTGTTERLRLTSRGGLHLANASLIERCKISSTALNSDQVCNLDDGMVHYRTSNLGGSGGTSLILTSSVGLATAMATGDMMSFTLIHAVNTTGNYVDHVNIDHLTVTEKWVGGSAPSSGGSSGVDIYTFNIIKKASGTQDTGFTVIGNHIKTS